MKEGSWPDAPADHLIIGLKELPEKSCKSFDSMGLLRLTVLSASPNRVSFRALWQACSVHLLRLALVIPTYNLHTATKGKEDGRRCSLDFPLEEGLCMTWVRSLAVCPVRVLISFEEFLEDQNRRRVAAFGYHAGYAGAAMALLAWAHGAQTPLPGKKPYNTESDLLREVMSDVEKGIAKSGGKVPQVLVIGALGRCGKGALDLCRAAGIPESNLLKWDMAETAKGTLIFLSDCALNFFTKYTTITCGIPPIFEDCLFYQFACL